MTEASRPAAAIDREPAPRAAGGRAGGPGPWRPAYEISARGRMEVLGAVMLALLLGALDQTIVGVALPRIVGDLRGNEYYTWAVTIYLLTSTISVPFYGKLSDIYGRRPLLLFGVSVFLIGSALCGLSQEMWQLILFRGIQGIGAGSLFPISLAVIGDLFSPAERGKYQGLFGAVFGLSAIVGPFLGGLLTDLISWHAIFYINIPVGLASLYVIFRVLPAHRRPGVSHALDIAGATVFTLGVAPILIGLTNARTGSWLDPWVGGLIGLGALLLLVFLWVESRADEPIIPLDLFRDRTYSATMAATAFSSFGFFSAVVFLPIYFQVVKGESATVTGWELLPLLGGVIIGSIVSGQIVARTGRYKALILVSLSLMALGSLLMTTLTADIEIWLFRLYMFVAGAGIGPTLAVFTIVIQNAVPFEKLGAATSSLTFIRQMSGSLGLAIAGSFFGSQVGALIPGRLLANGVPAQLAEQFSGSNINLNDIGAGVDIASQLAAVLPAQFQQFIPAIVRSIYEGLSLAVGVVFWIGVGAAVLAVIAALFVRELPLRAQLPGRARAEGGTTRSPQLAESPLGFDG